jgi:glycosyltransferase involved in cell wall biosynthesis
MDLFQAPITMPCQAPLDLSKDCVERNSNRALMVYIEPAPYIVGLIDKVRSTWGGRIDVAFVHEALTQAWGYELGHPRDSLLPSGPMKALRAIRQRLATHEYSLLHLAGWGHPVLFGALVLSASRGIPVIVETDTPLPHALSAWKRLAKAVLYRLLFRLPSMFLPAGSRQAAYLRHYRVQEHRIRTAQMTVDVRNMLSYSASLQPEVKVNVLRRYGIPEHRVRLLYVGRLQAEKGLHDLVRAFEKLRDHSHDVSLLIAGDGDLRTWVEQRASRKQNIYYLGRLAGENLWDTFSVSDIFVLPSHFENWGLVVNEAMACGLPVIVTDRVGCSDDLVRSGVTGLIVPAQSPESLFSAMKMLAFDDALRSRMGGEARRLIQAWTLENCARQTTAAWRLALS